MRRLYDVANILSCLKLIEKASMERRPCYLWSHTTAVENLPAVSSESRLEG